MGFPAGAAVKNQPVMQETQEAQVQSLGGEDPLEEENSNPPQYSCPKYLTDRGAWWAAVHRVSKSQVSESWASKNWTQLSTHTDKV
jgi:hypothetical protein